MAGFEAVIGLAPNLFYGTGLAASIMVLRHRKPADRTGKVLVVNAESLFRKGRNQNTLEPDHSKTILTVYQNYRDVPGLAAVVTTDQLAGNGFNLNIPLYVAPVDDGETVTLEEALADLEAAQQAARASRAVLEAELAKWGLV